MTTSLLITMAEWRSYCCFFFMLLCPVSVCGLQFDLPYNGESLTGVLGSSVNFTWTFRGGTLDSVQWGTKENGVPVRIQKVLVTVRDDTSSSTIDDGPYSGRVSGVWDGSSTGQATFTLNSIQKADERSYACRLGPKSLSVSPIFDNVRLLVVEAPQINKPSVQPSYHEASLVNISCTASGTPDPDVRWIRNKIVIGSGKKNAFLVFNSINRTDEGQYTCEANNSAGNDQDNMELVVHYPPTIKAAAISTNKSWIGQTVNLTCKSDGVPTPTLTWKKPNGSQIKRVTDTQNTVSVKMSTDQDFGDYTCNADNGLTTADFKIVKIQQIKEPGTPTITNLDIQATSLTVNWTTPADDGGSPLTGYRVVILKGSAEVKNDNITKPGTTSWTAAGDLKRATNYTVKVFARNAVFEGPAAEKEVRTKYEGVPAAATIYDLPNEVTNDSITLKWSEPQNNGKNITQYSVYQRIVTDGKPGEWIMLKTITSISVRILAVDLKKGKVYEFVVTAINEFGESLKEPKKFARVMASGVPAAVELNDIPSEVTDNEITLKWSAPEHYGRKIEQYTVYKRMVIAGKPGEWIKLEIITDVSVRELTVKVEQGEEYEFVVTASNVHGESRIEVGNIKRVMVKGDPGGGGGSQQDYDGNRMGAAIYAGAAAAGVLLIIGVIVIIVLWRRRKPSSDEDMSMDELGSANPYESEDGYNSVSREAAQSLQASGAAAEPDYAQVDQSKKKKNRMPANDEYAQVDKSKKTQKKKKKNPGELEYADLEDLRSDIQLGPVPSGGAAAAAPIVRPPAYEGTVYADISQFGVPQPDPTYANVPKQEVVYSNVESM